MKSIALFEKGIEETPIISLSGDYGKNYFFMKRDDLVPFSFGGNKARKAVEFYQDIKKKQADIIMTYGSNASNHCRIVANMAAAMGIPCHIISPDGHAEVLNNTYMVTRFGASIERCPVEQVSVTIEKRLEEFREQGKNPYFIMGGGHGNLGTEAYVKVYKEILSYENRDEQQFDYIFHASGTGTTQAGLVCGQLLTGDFSKQIVGISIARKKENGRNVVKNSIKDYLGSQYDSLYEEKYLNFTDSYICGGYGEYTKDIENTINTVMKQDGIPMDSTYVGKAFHGMLQYLQENNIENKKILFVHTGGTPLYFDLLRKEAAAKV